MAAMTFPSAVLSDLLRIESGYLYPEFFHEQSGLGSGVILVKEFVDQLWRGEFSTVPLYHRDTMKAEAILNAMQGSLSTFYMHDPRAPYPASDPLGEALQDVVTRLTESGDTRITEDGDVRITEGWIGTQSIYSVSVNRRIVRIAGFPPDFVLSRADYFSVAHDKDNTRGFYQVVEESVTADAFGLTPEFEISPPLNLEGTADDIVSVSKPSPRLRIVPGSIRVGSVDQLRSAISFSAIQDI